MAKKAPPANDPLIESLFDAISAQFAAIMMYGTMNIGPEKTVSILDRLIGHMVNQKAELEAMAKTLPREVNGTAVVG